MKKILFVFFLIIITTYGYYKLILQEPVFLYHSNEKWKFPVIILLLTLLLLISFIVDLSYRKRFTFFYLVPFCVFSFVSQENTLWPGELLLNKNYLFIGVILLVFVIMFGLVIFRSDSEFKWLNILQTPLKGYINGKRWRESNFFGRLMITVLTVILLSSALWAPYNIILTIGYLSNKEKVQKTARVIDYGVITSKNYSHRYWEIELDGKREKLMVYTVANAEGGYQFPVDFAPDTGSTLLINGKAGIFGFSYDKVVLVKNKEGVITFK